VYRSRQDPSVGEVGGHRLLCRDFSLVERGVLDCLSLSTTEYNTLYLQESGGDKEPPRA